MELWVVGKVVFEDRQRWEIQGVFDNEALAVAACRDEWYFVGPVVLNEVLPHESVEWPGAYYPCILGTE